MAEVKVYLFEAYDIAEDRKLRSRRPATLEAIARIGPNFYPVMETEEVIDDSLLDSDGFVKRPGPSPAGSADFLMRR
jgi:hypothetical protein